MSRALHWMEERLEEPVTLAEIAAVARRIEAASGLEVLLFPKEREYFLDMRIPA